jgi:hypothetical protein
METCRAGRAADTGGGQGMPKGLVSAHVTGTQGPGWSRDRARFRGTSRGHSSGVVGRWMRPLRHDRTMIAQSSSAAITASCTCGAGAPDRLWIPPAATDARDWSAARVEIGRRSIRCDVPVKPVWPNARGDSAGARRRSAHQGPSKRGELRDAAGRQDTCHQPRRADARRPSPRFDGRGARVHRRRHRAKEAGVSCDAVEGPRILVRGLQPRAASAQARSSSVGACAHWSGAGRKSRSGWPDRQRDRSSIRRPSIDSRISRQDEPEVAVDRSRARRVHRRGMWGDLVRRSPISTARAGRIPPRGQAGGVLEQNSEMSTFARSRPDQSRTYAETGRSATGGATHQPHQSGVVAAHLVSEARSKSVSR